LKKLQLPQQFFSITAAARSLFEAPKAEAQLKKYATRIPILILQSPAPKETRSRCPTCLHSPFSFPLSLFFSSPDPNCEGYATWRAAPSGRGTAGRRGWLAAGRHPLSLHPSFPASLFLAVEAPTRGLSSQAGGAVAFSGDGGLPALPGPLLSQRHPLTSSVAELPAASAAEDPSSRVSNFFFLFIF
jgi:hypothetical protein